MLKLKPKQFTPPPPNGFNMRSLNSDNQMYFQGRKV